jgi:hypothetical protein
MMNKTLSAILIMFMMTSCFEAAENTRAYNSVTESATGGSGGGNCTTGNCATNGDGSVGGEDNPIPKVEIRHLIEPKVEADDDAGEYKRKLTLPKNYDGKLYLAGINVSSLASKALSVRFNFGFDSNPYTIPATLSTAPGLTPQTNVEVLVMDLKGKPFEDINLLYDLFDYNEYDFSNSGNDPGALTEAVGNNRNDKLYCRGLSLKDDPTYSGKLTELCKDGDDVCKFAYVKIVDKGLIFDNPDTGNKEPIIPSELSIQSGDLGLDDDTNAIKLARCLPDDLTNNSTINIFDKALATPTFIPFTLGSGAATLFNGSNYYYQGSYQPINISDWQISVDARFGEYGIFDSLIGADINYGEVSKLFPLYTKFNLLSGVEYLGASGDADTLKTSQRTSSNTESLWMNGCNARVSSTHEITGEHIGSCNVTATIEILARDDDGTVTIVDITDEVKLQLVKSKELDTTGVDVLLSSYQQCSSSNQCGSDSCCINKRCWNKSIVGQCIEDLPNYGNQQTGDLCTSDYECSSLCCNKIDGRCAPHDTVSENPSYCSKPSGQSCVSQEWCQKHPVTTCDIIDTGTDALGGKTCALRCITAEVFGECTAGDGNSAGTCKPPCQGQIATFNPDDPNRCDNAVPLSQLIKEANNPTCSDGN